MKALSLRQPWAWQVVNAHPFEQKDIENRRWNTKFRGEFLIHAASGMSRVEYREARDWIEDVINHVLVRNPLRVGMPAFEDVRRGGFVGVSRVIGVVPPTDMMLVGLGEPDYMGRNPRWHMREQYGFLLADTRPLPFTPYKGALSFFEVPDEFAWKLLSVASS